MINPEKFTMPLPYFEQKHKHFGKNAKISDIEQKTVNIYKYIKTFIFQVISFNASIFMKTVC